MKMIEDGKSEVEVKEEAYERYNEALDEEAIEPAAAAGGGRTARRTTTSTSSAGCR